MHSAVHKNVVFNKQILRQHIMPKSQQQSVCLFYLCLPAACLSGTGDAAGVAAAASSSSCGGGGGGGMLSVTKT